MCRVQQLVYSPRLVVIPWWDIRIDEIRPTKQVVHAIGPVPIRILFSIVLCDPAARHIGQFLRVLFCHVKVDAVPVLAVLEALSLTTGHALVSKGES